MGLGLGIKLLTGAGREPLVPSKLLSAQAVLEPEPIVNA
jgi:hypothetical protein